jgi:choline dehydrogenase-like flavoprotein
MLSGIGNATALGALGIEPLVDNPDVGQNLQDHVFLTNNWNVDPSQTTLDEMYQNATSRAAQFSQWETSKRGPLVLNPANFVAWLRNPTDIAPFNTLPDPRYVSFTVSFPSQLSYIFKLALAQLRVITNLFLRYVGMRLQFKQSTNG